MVRAEESEWSKQGKTLDAFNGNVLVEGSMSSKVSIWNADGKSEWLESRLLELVIGLDERS